MSVATLLAFVALKREVKALTSQLNATQRQIKATEAPKAKVIAAKAAPKM